jgi:hypothetical protein
LATPIVFVIHLPGTPEPAETPTPEALLLVTYLRPFEQHFLSFFDRIVQIVRRIAHQGL